jgi:hypothetical protein
MADFGKLLLLCGSKSNDIGQLAWFEGGSPVLFAGMTKTQTGLFYRSL